MNVLLVGGEIEPAETLNSLSREILLSDAQCETDFSCA